MKLGYPTGFAGIAIPVVALIAYVLIALVAVRTVDGPPAVSPGPERVQTVTVHVDPAQAKSSFTRAFEIPAP